MYRNFSVTIPGSFWAVILCVLSETACALGSTSGALRDYKEGKYDEALKEYQKLLQRNSNDPRLHFNAGTAAYRHKNFEDAAKEFDAALAAPDLKLQGLSYYNRGNTLFRLGEQNPDPSKKTETWKGALRDFESSVKLNPQDADAKFNYEFVKKKLEELKQQQQRQSKSDQNQNQDQQQQQQNQQDQNSQKDQNQQQQQSQQGQSEQKQDSSQQNQQPEQQKQEEQKQPLAKDQSQQQKEQQQAQQQNQQQAGRSSGQPKDKPEGNENESAAATAVGQMTPEQARQLLDAQKSEEQLLQIKPDKKPVDRSRPFKDW